LGGRRTIDKSLVIGFVQAVLSVSLRANQLVVGFRCHLLALGATTFLYREIFGPLSRDTIPGFARLDFAWLAGIPIVGPALAQQTGLAYVGLALVVVTWALLKY